MAEHLPLAVPFGEHLPDHPSGFRAECACGRYRGREYFIAPNISLAETRTNAYIDAKMHADRADHPSSGHS